MSKDQLPKVYRPIKTVNNYAKYHERVSNNFRHLNHHIKKMVSLTAMIQPVFDDLNPLRVSVAHYDQQIPTSLTLAVNTLSGANHLNYLRTMYLSQLQSLPGLYALKTLKFIYVEDKMLKNHSNIFNSKTTNSSKIDDQSCQYIHEAAKIVAKNPALSKALDRLADKK